MHFLSGHNPGQCALGWFCLRRRFNKMTHLLWSLPTWPVCDCLYRMAPVPEPWIFSANKWNQLRKMKSWFYVSDSWLHVGSSSQGHLTRSISSGSSDENVSQAHFLLFRKPLHSCHGHFVWSQKSTLFFPYPQYSTFTTKTALKIMLTIGKYTFWD